MLSRLRNEIDAVDKEMLALFEQRMNIAKQIGDYKRQNSLPVYVPEREAEVIQSRVKLLKNPEYTDVTKDFFVALMEISRRMQ